MSEREIKSRWLGNWRKARDNERRACVRNDPDTAMFWADVAARIETRFGEFFNQNFGSFLDEYLA